MEASEFSDWLSSCFNQSEVFILLLYDKVLINITYITSITSYQLSQTKYTEYLKCCGGTYVCNCKILMLYLCRYVRGALWAEIWKKKLIQSIIKTILRKNKSKLYFSRTWKSSICSEIISTLILEIVVLLK